MNANFAASRRGLTDRKHALLGLSHISQLRDLRGKRLWGSKCWRLCLLTRSIVRCATDGGDRILNGLYIVLKFPNVL